LKTSNQSICVLLLAAMLVQPVLAQQAGAGAAEGQRIQGGRINYAPQPAVYSVIFIDAKGHALKLRAADGRTGVVNVPESTYDLSKLKPGQKVRVDFVAPDGKNSPLRAASIWPVN
jgi:hypothetical protein